MAKRKFDQPSFDFGPISSIEETCPAPSSVQDIPQALFLSWSDAMQLAYCARRDEDSAVHAENEEWRQFYLARAEGYRADLSVCIQ